MSGKSSATANPVTQMAVAAPSALENALRTLLKFLAPQLYPIIGCIPILSPTIGRKRNVMTVVHTPMTASADSKPAI